jgi:hypothetical protein
VNASKQKNRQQPFTAIPGTICFARTSAVANFTAGQQQRRTSIKAGNRGRLTTECALSANDGLKKGLPQAVGMPRREYVDMLTCAQPHF